jgi:hypothetical protein
MAHLAGLLLATPGSSYVDSSVHPSSTWVMTQSSLSRSIMVLIVRASEKAPSGSGIARQDGSRSSRAKCDLRAVISDVGTYRRLRHSSALPGQDSSGSGFVEAVVHFFSFSAVMPEAISG